MFHLFVAQLSKLRGTVRKLETCATSSAIAASFRIFIRIFGPHRECDAAASGKLRCNNRFARGARLHEIVQNPIRDCFVEGALVSIGGEIKLERLTFDAKPVWHIVDIDPGEVGLAGHRAKRCEIVSLKMNPIISSRRVRESFQLRFGG